MHHHTQLEGKKSSLNILSWFS